GRDGSVGGWVGSVRRAFGALVGRSGAPWARHIWRASGWGDHYQSIRLAITASKTIALTSIFSLRRSEAINPGSGAATCLISISISVDTWSAMYPSRCAAWTA